MVESRRRENRKRESLTTKNASLQDSNDSVDWRGRTLPASYTEFAVVFLATCLLLFFGMSRRSNVYDEGLALTGAMRVAAGQIRIGIFTPTTARHSSTFLRACSKYSESPFWSSGSSTSLSKRLSSRGSTRSRRLIAAELLLSGQPLSPCCGSSGCPTCLALRMCRRHC